MTDPIFLIDLNTEECVYVSPAIQALLGLKADELVGRPLTDFVHPDDRAKVVARSASGVVAEHLETPSLGCHIATVSGFGFSRPHRRCCTSMDGTRRSSPLRRLRARAR